MIKKTQLIDSWIWNKTVEDFIKENIKGYSINICAGKSSIGDIKIDLDPKNSSVIKGDMINIPYSDNTFDTVIEDPPWKIGFYQRMKPFFECVRICKVDGLIIYNAYWIPTSKYVELQKTFVRQDSEWSNTSIICVFKKIKNIDKVP